jgi:hypothetical protein
MFPSSIGEPLPHWFLVRSVLLFWFFLLFFFFFLEIKKLSHQPSLWYGDELDLDFEIFVSLWILNTFLLSLFFVSSSFSE